MRFGVGGVVVSLVIPQSRRRQDHPPHLPPRISKMCECQDPPAGHFAPTPTISICDTSEVAVHDLDCFSTTHFNRVDHLDCEDSIAIMAPRSYSKTYKVPRRREFHFSPSHSRNKDQVPLTKLLNQQPSSPLVCTFEISWPLSISLPVLHV